VDADRDTEGLEFDDCGYVRTGPFADRSPGLVSGTMRRVC